MTPPAPPVRVERDPTTVEQLIANVLRCAHRRAAPAEARGILHTAHLFADELVTRNSRFDRLAFIRTAVDDLDEHLPDDRATRDAGLGT